MRRRIQKISIAISLVAILIITLLVPQIRRIFHPLWLKFAGKQTIEDRLVEFANARKRIQLEFKYAGVSYPSKRVVLLGLKDEKRLEVYAGISNGELRYITSYPILAASGKLGPKLKAGDRQVPEGIYAVDSLNPNSKYHAAIRVGYPNAFDLKMAELERRTQLGGDIMIHGSNASVGCLAMGDPASEELFTLVANTGIENVKILLSPTDLRTRPVPEYLNTGWKCDLNAQIQAEIDRLPHPK